MSEPKKVLVVDDDVDLLEQVAMLMKSEGYAVSEAHGQEEAEDVLLSVIPDIAVIDLMMENMDSGFVLCHHIKRLYPETPVIILTAVKAATGLDFSTRNADAAAWVSADLVLDKPARPEQLKAEVKRLLKL
ncbi:MAG: response regulator [Myxococcota bacterium]|jgi:CheY-like chemotaxis protein